MRAFIVPTIATSTAAALIDAAEGYVRFIDQGGRMLVVLAGAASTPVSGPSPPR